MNTTVRIALKLIPDSLQTQPVFLCVDDTMVSKFGTKFENVSKLFDHAAHNGSNYLNGHCFVSVMLCVPVWNGDKVSYLSVPLGYRMWQKKESKLELAASMIRQVMPEFHSKDHVIILCDSWYTKQNLVSIIDEYPNLDLIGNARIDSVMYDLAPAQTGRRGRPAKHGKRLSLYIRKPCTIFFYEKVVKWCNNINFAVFHVIPPIVNPIFMQLVPHQLCFPVILLSDAFPHQPLL